MWRICRLPCPEMTLHSDLSRLIKGQLDKNSISYDGSMPLHRLVARYFEMNVRRVRVSHGSDVCGLVRWGASLAWQ